MNQDELNKIRKENYKNTSSLCMYICICMYAFMHVNIYMCVFMCMYIYTIFRLLFSYNNIRTYTYVHTFINTYS